MAKVTVDPVATRCPMRALHIAMSSIIPVALLLAGCHREDAGRAPEASPGAAAPAPAARTESNDPAITMRYSCQGDTRIEILGESARALLPDGRVVDLEKVAGSMPPTFTGDSLYFAIGSNDAHLSQEDGGNELACTAQ
jgi:hypothetical protein